MLRALTCTLFATSAFTAFAAGIEQDVIDKSVAPRDDFQKGNNPWGRVDFAAKAPGLDWNAYFAAAGLNKQKAFPVKESDKLYMALKQRVRVW